MEGLGHSDTAKTRLTENFRVFLVGDMSDETSPKCSLPAADMAAPLKRDAKSEAAFWPLFGVMEELSRAYFLRLGAGDSQNGSSRTLCVFSCGALWSDVARASAGVWLNLR